MNYLIRGCQEKDLPDIITLCAHHAEFEKAEYNPEGKAESLKRALFGENPVLVCWIVEVDNKAAGYATFTFNYSTWSAGYFLYMDCLYLEPEVRSMGIGADIMERLKKIAREKKYVNIQWQTPAFNERAIRFYKRIGGVGKEKVRFFINESSFRN